MRYLSILLASYFMFSLAANCQGQSKKVKKAQKEYSGLYESQTLAGNELPVMMPYNRWIKPAGEQIYFGDEILENHALDCALSPEK